MILYRYEIDYKSYEEDTSVNLREFNVVRETEASYCIKPYGGRDKWIRKSAHNKWAHTSKERAKEHFLSRTESRLRWYEYWKEECEKGIKLMEEMDVS